MNLMCQFGISSFQALVITSLKVSVWHFKFKWLSKKFETPPLGCAIRNNIPTLNHNAIFYRDYEKFNDFFRLSSIASKKFSVVRYLSADTLSP